MEEIENKITIKKIGKSRSLKTQNRREEDDDIKQQTLIRHFF